MKKTDMKSFLAKAQQEGWALGQFNFSDLKTLEAIVGAAEKTKSPAILGTSEGESRSVGLKRAAALVRSFKEERGLPLFLNLDHGKSFLYIKEAIDAGYDAVHFDGSDLSLQENIRITKEIVAYARKKGALVEGEVGVIGGELTGAEEAKEFAEKTGVDSLAINIGTWHGAGEKTGIDFRRLEEISRGVKKVFLVLHGGSGVPEPHIKKAIRLGIVKININTELRAAFTGALKKALKKPEIVPYKYMPEVVGAVQKVVENKIKLFGSQTKWQK